MSKSLNRVKRHAADMDFNIQIREMSVNTHTAQQAADALGCGVGQITKSIVFLGNTSGKAILFLTSGDNQVCPDKAAVLAQEPIGKADAALIRIQTGFAIGGVAPIGHKNPIRCFLDPHLQSYQTLWAAAGTPRHLFPISPTELCRFTDAIIGDFTR